MHKPILCLDFDGVIHSYASGWKGADVIPDPPVAGAAEFILSALPHFRVAIFSSRSNQPGGLQAMKNYISSSWSVPALGPLINVNNLEWPLEKPAAFVTIDDRALTFDGTWPPIEALKNFLPWNKRPIGPTGTFPDGKLDDDDQGAINLAITADFNSGVIGLDFGTLVAWVGFGPTQAREMAAKLLHYADKIDERRK